MVPRFARITLAAVLALAALSCSHALPARLPVAAPEARATSYTEALVRFGQMTELYETPELYVQGKDVVDRTGSPAEAGGIPFNVTEMLHSAVNRIGGRVTYVPFDPQYLTSQVNTRYTGLTGKARPQVVISGAISEYDRGIEVRSDKAGISADLPELPDRPGSVKGEITGAEETSSITLDMNLIDFATLAMVKQVQAVNTIKVSRVSRSADVSFSIFGPTFGLQGAVSKAQGPHAAVRVLVELDVLEILGKHLALPYWTCVPGAKSDPVVVGKWKATFRNADGPGQVRLVQKLLRAWGLEGVGLGGELDARTRAALDYVVKSCNCGPATLDEGLLERLLLSLPSFPHPADVDLKACNAAIAALPAPRESEPASQAAPQPEAPASAFAPTPTPTPAPTLAQPEVPDRFQENLALGKAALEQHRFDQAREHLEQALKVRADAAASVYYIYALQFLGREAELDQALKAALVAHPADVRFYRLNVKHLLSQDRVKEAGDCLRQGLAVQPGDPVLVMLRDYIEH